MLARKKYGCIARVRVHVHVRSHARETTIAVNAGGSARVHSGDLHCGGLRASAARPDRSRQRSSLRGAERDQTRDNETHNRRQNQENRRRRRGGRVSQHGRLGSKTGPFSQNREFAPATEGRQIGPVLLPSETFPCTPGHGHRPAGWVSGRRVTLHRQRQRRSCAPCLTLFYFVLYRP